MKISASIGLRHSKKTQYHNLHLYCGKLTLTAVHNDYDPHILAAIYQAFTAQNVDLYQKIFEAAEGLAHEHEKRYNSDERSA